MKSPDTEKVPAREKYTPPDEARINAALKYGQLLAAELLKKREELSRVVSPPHP